MKSLNKVTLIGRVGQDPKIIDGKNDSKFATFSVATSESRKNKNTGDWDTTTEWHSIVVYNPNFVDTTINHVTKGIPVYVEGELVHSSYKDKNGNEVKKTDVIIKPYRGNLIVLKDKDSSKDMTQTANKYANHFHADELTDDIPF